MLNELRLGDENTLLKNVDLRILSLGAGVQSSTVLYKIIEGEIEMVDAVIFADTGNEPKEVYDYLNHLQTLFKNFVEFHIVSHSNIIDDTFVKNYMKMPVYGKDKFGKKTIGQRQCTLDYKINPINKKIRELLDVKSLKGKVVEVVMGISFDEIQRAKLPRNKWQVSCYPLVHNQITRQDCLDYVNLKSLKPPPRSACIVCPYHSNDEWQHLKDNYPDEFAMAVKFDKDIRNIKDDVDNYLHSSLIPLEEVNFKRKNANQFQGSLFDDECEGICGV